MKRLVLFIVLVLKVLQSIGQISPDEISGINLWLRADSVHSIDGLIDIWYDRSGFGNHATMPTISNQPSIQSSNPLLNGMPSVLFDGQDDRFEINNTVAVGQIYVVARYEYTTFQDFIGLVSGPGISSTQKFFSGLGGQTVVFDGGYLGTTIKNNGIAIFDFIPIDDFHIYSGHKQNTTAMPLRIGQDGPVTLQPRFWTGEIAEVIAYDAPLDSLSESIVIEYLRNRYGSSAELGDDILMSNFCDTIIAVIGEFQSVLWSTNENTNSISVTNNGDYSVEVVDSFGGVTTDTVQVTYPGHFISPFLLCQSQDSLWDTGLSESDGFTFTWDTPTPNTGPTVLINEPGMYNVVITDSQGCTREASVEVTQDDYPVSATLGPDQDLCSGNSLTLQSGAESTISYEWNDQPGTAEYPISESGTYWVEAINENGCIAQDTIEVTIIGEAPQSAFGFTNLCFGDNVQFVNNATAPAGESIISQTWDFGDNATSDQVSPLHTYSAVDTFIVSLQVETAVGCLDAFTDTLIIRPVPASALWTENLCHDQFAFFIDTSVVSTGAITSSEWLFDGADEDEGHDLFHLFDAPGMYAVQLTSQTDFGCESVLDTTIEVLGSPIASFIVDAVCLSEPTLFTAIVDETFSGPANQYFWDFGFLTSIFETTTHTFLNPGLSEVSLTVTALNGCADTYIGNAVVGEDPIAGFEIGIACAGQLVQFTDTSIVSPGDQVQSWNWFFSASEESTEPSPAHIFDLPGIYPISLNVESQVGCSDQVLQEIEVSLVPTAEFDFSPILGAPPFTPVFENFSEGATEFLWTFDFGVTSTDEFPTHTFTDSGEVQIDLQVWNEAGCTASASELIFLTEPLVDLVLIDVTYELTGDFIYPTLLVTSLSNFDMESFVIDLEVAEGVHIQEVYQGGLERNQVLEFPMNTAIVFDSETDLPFFCIELIPSDSRIDMDATNNTKCLEIGTDNDTYFFRPRPNPLQDELSFTGINVPEGDIQVDCFDLLGRPVLSESLLSSGNLIQDFTLDFRQVPDGRYVLRIVQATEDRVYRIQVLRN